MLDLIEARALADRPGLPFGQAEAVAVKLLEQGLSVASGRHDQGFCQRVWHFPADIDLRKGVQ